MLKKIFFLKHNILFFFFILSLCFFIFILWPIQKGVVNSSTILDSCETYDALSGVWTTIRPMISKRKQHVMAAYENKIYVFGGYDDDDDDEKKKDEQQQHQQQQQ